MADGSVDVALDTTIGWQPAADADSYSLSFGAHTLPASPNATGLTVTSWDPPGQLEPYTTYVWQITAHNADGSTAGPVWSFVTAPDRIIYLSASASSGGDGSFSTPYATLAEAVNGANFSGVTEIRIAAGTYDYAGLELTAPATLRGGYDPNDLSTPPDPATHEVVITSTDTSSAAENGLGFSNIDPDLPHGLSDLVIRAQAVGSLPVRYALTIDRASPIVRDVTIEASNVADNQAVAILVQEGSAPGQSHPASLTLLNSIVTGTASTAVSETTGVLVNSSVTGTITIEDSTISSGDAAFSAVAIDFSSADATIEITDSTVVGGATQAGAAWSLGFRHALGTATVTNSTMTAGAVAGDRTTAMEISSGDATVTGSTFTGGTTGEDSVFPVPAVMLSPTSGVVFEDNVVIAGHADSSVVSTPHVAVQIVGADVTVERSTLRSSGAAEQTAEETGIRIVGTHSGLRIVNNVLHHRPGSAASAHYYGVRALDAGVVEVYNNTIVSTHESAPMRGITIQGNQSSPSNPDLRNNLFASTSGHADTVGIWQANSNGVASRTAPSHLLNNGFSGLALAYEGEGGFADSATAAELDTESRTTRGAAGTAEANLVASFSFEDAAAGDFRLTGAVGASAGADLSSVGVTVDRDGLARTAPYSIGAYELD